MTRPGHRYTIRGEAHGVPRPIHPNSPAFPMQATKLIILGCLAALALSGSLPARAADRKVCESTQAAIELRSCPYCREVKRILSDPELAGIHFDVTDLRVGASVHISADNDASRLLMQEFVQQMWGATELDAGNHVCDFCAKRRAHLSSVTVDWAATSDGIEMVLITDDPALARWTQQDARVTQGWVLGSAER